MSVPATPSIAATLPVVPTVGPVAFGWWSSRILAALTAWPLVHFVGFFVYVFGSIAFTFALPFVLAAGMGSDDAIAVTVSFLGTVGFLLNFVLGFVMIVLQFLVLVDLVVLYGFYLWIIIVDVRQSTSERVGWALACGLLGPLAQLPYWWLKLRVPG